MSGELRLPRRYRQDVEELIHMRLALRQITTDILLLAKAVELLAEGVAGINRNLNEALINP